MCVAKIVYKSLTMIGTELKKQLHLLFDDIVSSCGKNMILLN